MVAFAALLSIWLFLLVVPPVHADCFYPSPAFPAPGYNNAGHELQKAFDKIEAALKTLISDPSFDTSSFSIEVTSPEKTLWSSFHTARDKDPSRPGAIKVDNTSAYRIASITKTFTVLGILQQHAAGNISLDAPVDYYVSVLRGPQKGGIPWHRITLRSLASQLSGLPRDWSQGDLLTEIDDPTLLGLPPAIRSGLPKCGAYGNYTPCTEAELIETVQKMEPVLAPNQQSTYSNIAFEILGLVLSNVTGLPYEEYIAASILKPLAMNNTTFSKPQDTVAVLPKGQSQYWDVDEGVLNPTGGLYATSADLSTFLRYILTHFNDIISAANWLQPASFDAGVNSFYGMPWEIFRTNAILPHQKRAVTFFTKSGGQPGYVSNIFAVPDYNLGITILVAGNPVLLGEIRDIVTVPLIQAADVIAQDQLRHKYAGEFATSQLNSSITLSHSPTHGLHISRWISNGTDMLSAIPTYFSFAQSGFRTQLVPTFLYRDVRQQTGERWRLLVTKLGEDDHSIWGDFCVTDIDTLMYDGRPLNEAVFWNEDENGRFTSLELTAFRLVMDRLGEERLAVQEL